MTLATVSCSLFSATEFKIRNKLKELDIFENEIKIELTYEPPRSFERLLSSARAMLGLNHLMFLSPFKETI